MLNLKDFMARKYLTLLGLLLLVTGSTFAEVQPSRSVVESAIAKVKPSLVRIQVVTTYFDEGRELKHQAVGSGVIISKDGYLVTNHHVAGHGTRFFCTLSDREEIEAELIGTDPLTDIAVLKLKPSKPRKFPVVSFADSTRVKVGDPVLALGSPMALSQSVTLGIASNTEMTMPKFFGPRAKISMDGEDVGMLVRWIAHDAAIYGGNSGGPLVNLKGEIIGINEISMGLAGAIPGNLAKSSAEQIIAHGRVIRSWIGLEIQPLLKSMTADRGALISGMMEDSPVAATGIKPGDILTSLNHLPVYIRYDEQMPELFARISALPLGQEIPLTVLRDGKEITFNIKPTERTELNPKEQELKAWGLTVHDISFQIAKEMKRPNQNGALVTSARSGGPSGAAKPPIAPEDVIVEVAGQPVHSSKELAAITDKLLAGKTTPLPVLVAFEDKNKRFLTVVKIGTEDMKDPGLEATKAWLPIETQVISRDIAKQIGQPDLKGYCITLVYDHSTAKKAGLKAGDFIISVDDEKLTAFAPEHEDDLATLIRQYDVGATVKLGLIRDGKKQTVAVELARSPRLRREMKKYRNDEFEFTLRDITFFDRAEEEMDQDETGVLVEEVKSGSWAELGSLYAGDFILEINNQTIKSIDSARAILEKIVAQKPDNIVMKIKRGVHTRFLEFQPNWKTAKN